MAVEQEPERVGALTFWRQVRTGKGQFEDTMAESNNQIGEVIRRIRRARGISSAHQLATLIKAKKAEGANIIRVSASTIKAAERGTCTPRPATLHAIAVALGFDSFDQLLASDKTASLNRPAPSSEKPNRTNRDIDTHNTFCYWQERYDHLVYEIVSCVKEEEGAKGYYRRYWGLQFDQWISWKAGFIQDEVYGAWMGFRFQEWKRNDDLKGISYKDGWKFAIAHWGFPDEFLGLMVSVFSGEHPLVKSSDPDRG